MDGETGINEELIVVIGNRSGVIAIDLFHNLLPIIFNPDSFGRGYDR